MSMMKWIEVEDEATLKFLRKMGAKIVTKTMAKVPHDWKGCAASPSDSRAGKPMPTGDKWFKADDCATLAATRSNGEYRAGSSLQKVWDCLKTDVYPKGDMKLVLSRNEIEAALQKKLPSIKRQTIRNSVTTIFIDGGLRRAGKKTGPEQAPK